MSDHVQTTARPADVVMPSPAPAGLFGWYREMTPPGRKSFWAAYVGWCLDAADAQVFNFLIPTLMATWALSSTQIGTIATATWVSAAIGGWLGGILADRLGRVRALQITILCFAGGALLCGLAQSYEQLLIFRSMFGLGFGGEWAIGAVLVSEIAPAARRGLIGGIVQSAFTTGWILSAILYPVFYHLLPEHLAWRGLLVAGALPALFIFFVRRYVPEPQIYLDRKKEKANGTFLEIFSPRYLRTTITLALLGVGVQGGTIGLSTWLPTYLRTVRQLPPAEVSSYMLVFLVSTVVGFILGAIIADAWGRRWSFILGAIAQSAMVVLYMNLPLANGLPLLLMGIPMGVCFGSVFGGVVATYSEMFPTRLRGSGVGFCFNVGRGAGALSGLFVGMFAAKLTLGISIATFVSLFFALAVISALLMPETKGERLT